MSRFHLFKVRVERPPQPQLGDLSRPTPAIIASAMEEGYPSYRPPRGAQWRLGDIQHLGEGGYYFTIGKITKQTMGSWDEEHHGFVHVEGEPASWTEGVIDVNYQICGLAPNTAVDTRVENIAKRVAGLLNTTRPAAELGYAFHVEVLRDPVGFIEHIRQAHRVTKFEFWLTMRNFFDAGEVTEALEKTLESFGGDYGKFVAGKQKGLDKEAVEAQSRRVAQAAQDATAWIEDEPGSKGRPVHMGGIPVVEEVDSFDTEQERRTAWQRFVERYLAIRKNETEEE